jgi:hypothetical protein
MWKHIKVSSENSDILKDILEDESNKQMIIDLSKKILGLKVNDIKFDKISKFENISEYEFSAIKTICSVDESEPIDIYFKLIKKDKIKESIFCYWCLLYEDGLQKTKEEITMSTIINKVQISEIGTKRYKNSVFLQIENNKTDILKYGTEIHFIDFLKYIENNKSGQNKIGDWLKYIECDNEDILMVGVVLNKSIGRSNIEIV